MVFVNSKKFACESCIKGHRSSACAHTDRPLFEIKKKGRPVSQCEKCRSLRQSRKMHSKCNCTPEEKGRTGMLPLPASAGSKAKRFIPIAPALPNGLKDLQSSSQTTITVLPDSRQQVDSLLNPCACKDVWKCKCSKPKASSNGSSSGLTALAQAAALCDTSSNVTSTVRPRSNTPPPQQPPSKRSKRTHTPLKLPPLLHESLLPDSTPSPPVPDFGFMPSLSEISSIAGSGCTCGVECNCPGCVEHRGPEHVDNTARSCADGCGHCTDNRYGIGLPGQADPAVSIIDKFFARAAALPAPPINRKMGLGTQIDPMNVMVYPKTAIETKERGVPFGLITVPKLECCGGRCACPEGTCTCGNSCDGSCAEHAHENQTPVASQAKRSCCAPPPSPIPAVRSCCAGKSVSS